MLEVVVNNPSRHKNAFLKFLAKHLTGKSFKRLGETQQGKIQSLATKLRKTETKRDMTFHPVKKAYFSLDGTPVELPVVYREHPITDRIETFFAHIEKICND